MKFLSKLWSWLAKAPSFVWILVFLGGLIGFIGGIIILFFLLANVEGVASILLLLAGWFSMGALVSITGKSAGSQIAIAGAITFYALMGMAIDQPGNIILNQPLQWLCPTDSTLNRGVNVTHPLPGRTDMTQDYRCLDGEGKTVKRLSLGPIIGIRFVEYVVIAYLMIGLHSVRKKKSTSDP